MGGAASMIHSGAVGEVGGMIISGAVGEVGGMMVSSTVSSITNGFEMQEGLHVTLYSLQQEVFKFQCAIEAARGRRITNNNQKLLEWLTQIIYASYLGEYYLRTFESHTSLPPMIASPQGMSDLFSNYPTNRATKRQRTIRTFLFGNDQHREVHDVLKKLRSFDMGSFLHMVNALPERPMKRYLYMEPTRLIYRDKEKEQIMKFLFEPNIAGENNVDILPIVGSEGVGKTALALECFYDTKVQTHFSVKIYIARSGLYYPDQRNPPLSGPPFILQDIISELNHIYVGNFDENTLLAMLKQNLSSEKFLIVMDNVWIHQDLTIWNSLLGCLRCGKQGSKIIFTSHLIVYKEIKNHETVKPIMLDGFREDDYMLFFMEHAFGSADPEDFPDLAKLGGEIAKKLNGSIWGAKIIGELLRDNLNARFWSIFSRVGILSSKSLWPVVQTLSQLLSKSLCLMEMLIMIGDERSVLADCNRVKSFRDLMVLGRKYFTPVIKQGKNDRLEFFVTKHFDLYRSSAIFAICELRSSQERDFAGIDQ